MKIIEEELSKNKNLKIPPSYINEEKPQIEIPPSEAIKEKLQNEIQPSEAIEEKPQNEIPPKEAIQEKPQNEIPTKKAKDSEKFFQEAKPDDLVSVKEKDEKYFLFKKKLGLKSSNSSNHFTNLAKEFNSKLT